MSVVFEVSAGPPWPASGEAGGVASGDDVPGDVVSAGGVSDAGGGVGSVGVDDEPSAGACGELACPEPVEVVESVDDESLESLNESVGGVEDDVVVSIAGCVDVGSVVVSDESCRRCRCLR